MKNQYILNTKYLPKADVVFSVMFFHKELFERTIAVITNQKVEVNHLEQEAKNEVKSALLNSIYFDMKAIATDGSIITLDLQRKYQKERIRNRVVYYACREIAYQKVEKSYYENLNHVLVTFILTEAPKNSTVNCRRVKLVDIDTHEIYADVLSIFEVGITQVSEMDCTEMQILKNFFAITTQEKMDVFLKQFGNIPYAKLLLEQYMYAVAEPDFLRDLEQEEKYMFRLTEEERLSERAEGIKQSTYEFALRMLANQEPLTKIMEYTGLSQNQLEELAKLAKQEPLTQLAEYTGLSISKLKELVQICNL